MLRDVLITADKTPVRAVVLEHQKGMKEAWCIATNRIALGAAGVVKLYARRFTIEETFRDIKDNHFGMGLAVMQSGLQRDQHRGVRDSSPGYVSWLCCATGRHVQRGKAKL